MEFNFTQTMQNETDENLIKIVTVDRDGYQPDAVITAEAELAKRKISTKTFEETKKDHEQTRKIEIEKANAPLENATKLIVFFIPIIFRFLSISFNRDGYERKAAEATKWAFIGMAFYLMAIILLNSI